MKRIFKKRLWMQVMAVVLAIALNIGVFDGIVRYTMQELALGSFDGFLGSAAAKNVEVEKNKNALPKTAEPKPHKDPLLKEAQDRLEVVAKRTERSKTFKLGNDEFKTEVYQDPIHYTNGKGQLVDIDNTLMDSPDKDFSFENKANNFKVKFTEKTGGKKLVKVQLQKFAIEWGLLGSKEAKGKPSNNTITYSSVSENVHLCYSVTGETLKEDIILNSPAAQAEFKFALNLTNLDYKVREDGSIDFIEPRTGAVIWVMPKLFMYDGLGEESKDVTAKIGFEKGKPVLTVTADEKWLSDPKRQFPVVIDPTLQPGDRFGCDTFISSASPYDNYNAEHALYVGNAPGYGDTASFLFFRDITREKNITITGANFSIWAQEGNLSSIKLHDLLVDWVWDYKVLTWDYWQKRTSLGQTIGEVIDTSSGPVGGWWTFDVKELVQKWVNNSTDNHGFALYSSGGGYKKFISSNYGTNESEWSKHPKLEYTYTLNPPEEPADFKLSTDRKTGLIKAYGTAVAGATVKLAQNNVWSASATADGTGKWEIGGLSFDKGNIRTISVYYTYEKQETDDQGNTQTITVTSATTHQNFLITRYSKGARMKKMAKLYYYDGTKAEWLKEVNGITNELEMVVGDYVLVLDPRENRPYAAEPIITDPDEEYRLREKVRPLYGNGEVVGDSVDAATGNFFVLETDLSFDAQGLPIDFTRVFNSQEPEQYRGPFGLNWQFAYAKMLIMYADGSILATGGDGGGYFFRPSGNGFVTDSDVTETLVKNGDGSYSVVTKYNTVYHFNIEGILDKITDRNGNAVTLTYDPEGLLRTVSDATGRTCKIVYDHLGRITMIQDPESRQVEYDYDSWGRLLQVIDPNGGVTKYFYGSYDEKGQYNTLRITQITDPMENAALINTYDSQGRVKTQTDAEKYTVELEYDNKSTIFTDKNDEAFVYHFDDKYRVLSIEGPAVETGLPVEKQMAATVQTSGAGTRRGLVQYHYDSKGYRDWVKDAKGYFTYYNYDAAGNIQAVLNNKGKGTRYEYNDPNNKHYPTDIIDALNNSTHIRYDGKGNLQEVTNAKNETTVYTYYSSGLVETVTDPAGKQVAYTYHPEGTVENVRDGRGYYTYYYYDSISRLTEVVDPKGYPSYYRYDDNSNLLKEITPEGEIVNSYNKNNSLIGMTDQEKNVSLFEYDKRGYLTKEISPLSHATRFEYDGNGNRRKAWDAEENLTEYRYNALGLMKQVIQPNDRGGWDTTHYYYDANANRVGVKDPLENTTIYNYDEFNRLESISDPDSRTAKYTYDDVGNTLVYEDFDGTQTEYRYDKLSRVEEIIDTLKNSNQFTYDRSGNRETVTNALKQKYTYRYDGNNNLWQVEDPDKNITEFSYDKNNNRETVKDALENITTYHYDKLNRLWKITDPLQRSAVFGFDKNGNRVSVTDGNKHTTRYEYDADGRLGFVYDAKENMTQYKYDKAGNLRFFIDANQNETEYRYNSKNMLTKAIDPLKRETEFQYDENGNLKFKTDRNGIRVEYDYDKLNRLKGAYYPDGSYVEYGYNEKGKREWMEDMHGTTWYDYDELGRLNRVINQDEIPLEYEYNALGQKTLVRYPDKKEVSYEYNNLNRLITVKDRFSKETTYDYDKIGRRTTTTLPNGVATTYGYDNANQLKEIASVNANLKMLAKYEYDYDDAGNRRVFSQTVGESVYTTEYFYDEINQLERVLNPDGSRVGYQYDKVGNRLKMTRVEGNNISTTKYDYNKANELNHFNVNDGPFTSYRYDKNGNRTAKIESGNKVTNYTWDYENRLTKVQLHQDKWVGFEYDGDGNRITKLSAMTAPQQDTGISDAPGFTAPGNGKAKKQQSDLMYLLLKNDGSNSGGNSGGNSGSNSNSGGNSGSNSNSSSGGNSGNNSGSNGNGQDKDKSNNGNGKNNDDPSNAGEAKDKENNGKGQEKVKSKELEQKEKQKDQYKAKNGYRQKGKNTNNGKHLGWYKNGKIPGEKVKLTYYLNDVSDSLTQVLMTYNENDSYDAAYTYGLERIEVEAVDESRPESQDPLYYLYDGLGSVTFMVKPDGNIRDHYRYDEFGKPAPGNSKLSEDGRNVLHSTFGYTGEMWDEESELLYLRARYYEPETGRFLSRDSYEGEMENPLSKHLYAYVQNNPLLYVDPSGKRTYIVNGINNPKESGPPDYAVKFQEELTKRNVKDVRTIGIYNLSAIVGGVKDVSKEMLNIDVYSSAIANKILDDLKSNPLKKREQLNLIGYSGGGQVVLNVCSKLDGKVTISNTITIGAPVMEGKFKNVGNKTTIWAAYDTLSWTVGYGYKHKFAGWFGHTDYFSNKNIGKIANMVDDQID